MELNAKHSAPEQTTIQEAHERVLSLARKVADGDTSRTTILEFLDAEEVAHELIQKERERLVEEYGR